MAKQEEKKGAAGKAAKNKKFKKRERKNVPYGLVYVQASFNNTIVTITDGQGNTLSWKSSGSPGLPRLPQGDPVRRPAGSHERRQPGARSRSTFGRCTCQRSRLRP